MERILLTCIKNPFKPVESRITKRVDHLPSIRHAVREFFPAPLDTGFDVVVSLTTATTPSRILTDKEIDLILPKPGDSIVFAAVPHGGGGGGGGKDILGTVAMIAVMIVATVVTAGVGSVLMGGTFFGTGMVAATGSAALFGALAGAGVMVAGGLLVNAILPTSSADSADASFSTSDYSTSNTYSWDPSSNADQEGGMLPVLYGTHRITPPIIGRYVSTSGDSQYLNILYALCEGGETGIDSITDIEINGNPSTYFSNIAIATRLGTNDQAVIPYFNDTIADVAVGAKLSTSWVTRTTTGNTTQALGVGIVLPNGLFYANDNGGLSGQTVGYQIQYKKHGDLAWSTWGTFGVTASQSSAIRRYHRLDNLSPDQYDVRVILTSALPAGSRYRNDTYWEYVEEIVYDDFAYPGVALLALNALATDQLSNSTPRVTCLATRSTVPVWTGAAYEDKPATNPAWACYDILHNDEYGGGVPYSRIIYEKFAEWAAWCDTKGYTCNIYFDAIKNLRKALDTICTLGRGNILQIGSKFTCIYDGDVLPAQSFLFTMGNIIKDSFAEEWLPMDDRANQVEVVYYDAELNYDKQTVVIEQDGFDSLGVEVTPRQVDLVGCTDRDMAIKHGKYLLNCNRYITNTTSFDADVDSIGCLPGDVVEVAHDVPQWGYSGRVVSATANTVTLDREVTLERVTTYKVKVQHLDTDVTEELTVEAVSEATTTGTLTLTTSWANIPAKYALYSFGQEDRVTKLFRITKITRAQDMRRKITAVEHVPDVYDDIATVVNITNVSDLVRIKDLTATEIIRTNKDGSSSTLVSLTWHGAAVKWQVYKSVTTIDGPWELIGETGRPFFEVSSLTPDQTYYFAVSATHTPEDGESTSIAYTGDTYEPDVPTDLAAQMYNDSIVLTWAASANVIVAGYNIYLNDTLIVSGYTGNRYVYKGSLAAGTYNFKITALNGSGEESDETDETTVSISVPATPAPTYTIAGEILTITWDDCTTSIPIKHYTVNGVINGSGRTYTKRINWTGTQTFEVQAVDICGNESTTGSSDVTVTAIPAPTALTATGQTYAVRLDMTHTALTTKDVIEVWESATNNRDDAVHIGDTPSTSFTRTGLPLVATRYYWVRIRDIYGNLGAWYPESSTAGVAGTTSTDPADYLSVLAGSITEDALYQTLNDRIDQIDTEAFIYDEDIIEPNIYNGIAGAYSGLYNIASGHETTINGLLSTAAEHASEIGALQSEVASLTTVEWSATGDYTLGKYVVYSGEVYRCIQAYTYSGDGTKTPGVDTDYWEEADALATLVSSIETRVDDLEGEIVTKVSTTTFDALENRVDTTESSISQNAGDILLRVTQTEFDAFSVLFLPEFSTGNTYEINDWVQYDGASYKCIQTIDFSPAPLPTNATYWEAATYANEFTTIMNQVEVNTSGISLMSSAITGDLAFLFDTDENRTFESGVYVETAEDVRNLDIRLTQAGMDIDGAEATIALHASLIDGIDDRLSQAEIDIDGANAQIALKASQSSLDETNTELTAAEVVIDGHTASIGLHATQISTLQSTTGTHTTQIGQAQIDIDAAEAAIALKASQTALDTTNSNLSTLTGRVSTAETAISAGEAGTWASISNKVAIASYNADQYDGETLRIAAAETAIGVIDDDVDGLKAEYTVKLNANGRVAGIGLVLDEDSPSEFIVLADKFQVVDPSDEGEPKAVFTVGNIGGVSAVGVNGDLIIDGSLNASRIGAGSINITWDGSIRGGATDFLEGKGFFLGYSDPAYKFFVGDPANKYLAFDGNDLSIGRNTRLLGADGYGDEHIFLHERPMHQNAFYCDADFIGTSYMSHGVAESSIVFYLGYCNLGVYTPAGYSGSPVFCYAGRLLPVSSIQEATWTKTRRFITRVRFSPSAYAGGEIISGQKSPALGIDNYNCHFGFRFIGTALYGSCGDGVTGAKLDLGVTVPSASTGLLLEAAFTPGEDVEFFVNGVSKGTIATHLPGSAAGHDEDDAYMMMMYTMNTISGSAGVVSSMYEFSDYKVLQD